jgi:hypothetical protein
LTISDQKIMRRRLISRLFIIILALQIYHAKIFNGCRFFETFYKTHSNIFQLNHDQTSLTMRPLYALSNQSFSSVNQSLSIGIIYRLADTYLVPVPLLFQCPGSEQIYAPNECEFTIIDNRVREIVYDEFISSRSIVFFSSQIYQYELPNQLVRRLFHFISRNILHQFLFHYVVLILNNQQLLYVIVV